MFLFFYRWHSKARSRKIIIISVFFLLNFYFRQKKHQKSLVASHYTYINTRALVKVMPFSYLHAVSATWYWWSKQQPLWSETEQHSRICCHLYELVSCKFLNPISFWLSECSRRLILGRGYVVFDGKIVLSVSNDNNRGKIAPYNTHESQHVCEHICERWNYIRLISLTWPGCHRFNNFSEPLYL